MNGHTAIGGRPRTLLIACSLVALCALLVRTLEDGPPQHDDEMPEYDAAAARADTHGADVAPPQRCHVSAVDARPVPRGCPGDDGCEALVAGGPVLSQIYDPRR